MLGISYDKSTSFVDSTGHITNRLTHYTIIFEVIFFVAISMMFISRMSQIKKYNLLEGLESNIYLVGAVIVAVLF